MDKIKWLLCQGHNKKRVMQPEDDFYIEQGSSSLNSIDIDNYCNTPYSD